MNPVVQRMRSALLLALVASAGFATAISAPGAEPAEIVPEDTCVVELTLPEEATVSVDGRDYGTNRTLTFRSLERGKIFRSKLVVTFRGGKREVHELLIRGGWRVPLVVAPPDRKQPELVLQTGHAYDPDVVLGKTSVAFSPDGRRVLTGSYDGTAIIWAVDTGRVLKRFEGHADAITSVAFAPDGRQILTGSFDRTAILWDVATGEKRRVFSGGRSEVLSAAFSPDGRHVITGLGNFTHRPNQVRAEAILWDAATGAVRRRFAMETDYISSVAFSSNGNHILTATFQAQSDVMAVLWNKETGRQVQSYRGDGCYAVLSADGTRVITVGVDDISAQIAVSPDGRHLVTPRHNEMPIVWDAVTGRQSRSSEHFLDATGDGDGGAKLWDLANRKAVQVFKEESFRTVSTVFSPDGKQVLAGSGDGRAILWDTATGELLRVFAGHIESVTSVALCVDGRQVLSTAGGCSASIWNTAEGVTRYTFECLIGGGVCTTFSRDGRYLFTAPIGSQQGVLWDAASGRELRRFGGFSGFESLVAFSPDGQLLVTMDEEGGYAEIRNVGTETTVNVPHSRIASAGTAAFSPDGRQLITGSPSLAMRITLAAERHKTAELWDTTTGKQVRSFLGHSRSVNSVAFSPDGQQVLTGSSDNTAILWSVSTGKALRVFKGHTDGLQTVAFSPDGRLVVTGGWDNLAILWNTATGARLRTLKGHDSSVNSVAFGPNSQHVVTGSHDGTARLWDLATGRELARLVHLVGEDWLVVTLDGFFDGSQGGMQKVSYQVGNGSYVVPVERFFQDFYRPGLLAAIMRGERPLPTVEIDRQLPPKLRIVSPEPGPVESREVTVVAEATDQGGGISHFAIFQNGSRLLTESKSQQDGKTLRRTFQVRLVEGDNELSVRAACEDGSWESEPASVRLRYEKPVPGAELYLVAIGINQYTDETLNLRFARADAEAMVRLFESRGPALYGQGKVHTWLLVDEQATKDNIQKTLAEVVERAQPQDTLVVSLSGHGTMLYQRYFFLPHEARCRPGRSVEDEVREFGIPGDTLNDWISRVPALKRVSIFDTCQSGGAIAVSQTARSTWQFQKALETMARSQGSFIIAATAAGDEAQEVPDLGHGVLTYTLLAGLGEVEQTIPGFRKLEPPEGEKLLTVRDWFGFAQDRVPTLSKLFFKREQLVNFQSRGQNFPILPMARE